MTWSKYLMKKLRSYKIPEFENNLYKIYLMIDPKTNEVFYIGCTKCTIFLRMSNHYTDSFCRRPVSIRLQDLASRRLIPKIKIVYQFEDKQKARIVEKYLIHFLSNNNLTFDLANTRNVKTVQS